MPHTASAWKRMRKTAKRQKHNRSMTKALKLQNREVATAVKVGDLAKAEDELKLAFKKLDQAGSKRIIHPNKAARLKSRLAKRIDKAKKAATTKA